jgi:hypothetical protein
MSDLQSDAVAADRRFVHRQRGLQRAQAIECAAQRLRLPGDHVGKVFELTGVGVGDVYTRFFMRQLGVPAALAAVLSQPEVGQ